MTRLRELYNEPTDVLRSALDNGARYYSPYGAFPALAQLPPSPGWDAYLCGELYRLQSLQNNWDGYGSPPLDPQIAHDARNILAQLWSIHQNSRVSDDLPPPYLVPISGGALQAEWHIGSKIIELFFDHSLQIEAHFYDTLVENQDESHELEIKGSSINLSIILEWFHRINNANLSSSKTA